MRRPVRSAVNGMVKNTNRSSARTGKPDVTGRSSGRYPGRRGKINKPPKDEPWVWLTKELLESDAWCALSPNGHSLIDFLLLEHNGWPFGDENSVSPCLQEKPLCRLGRVA